MTQSLPHLAQQHIHNLYPDFIPKVGIVLGSGLSRFTQHLDDPAVIPYDALPGFPASNIIGHENELVLGYVHKTPVVCLRGRTHGYEGDASATVKNYVRTLKLLGCEYFIATNASGSMQTAMAPGSLMLITDHINLQPTNPLVGPNDDTFGPRFYPLDKAYCPHMQADLLAAASARNITLHQGTYIAVLGPHYETAAEIRAFRTMGADAVGMSTVPEVLVANHCGMKVAAIATLTNYATGLATSSHSHEAVVRTAEHAARALSQLLIHYLASIK